MLICVQLDAGHACHCHLSCFSLISTVSCQALRWQLHPTQRFLRDSVGLLVPLQLLCLGLACKWWLPFNVSEIVSKRSATASALGLPGCAFCLSNKLSSEPQAVGASQLDCLPQARKAHPQLSQAWKRLLPASAFAWCCRQYIRALLY